MRLQASRTTKLAFTLIELSLALAVSSVIGLIVVLLLTSMGAATDSKNDTRRANAKRQVAIIRLGAMTRSAAMVLAAGPQSLVLWKGDANLNGKPDLSELRRVAWNMATAEIVTYEAPAEISGSDVTYELDTDFDAVTASLADSSLFPGTLVLTAIADWGVAFDTPHVQSARLARLRVTIQHDSGPEELTVIAHLRIPVG